MINPMYTYKAKITNVVDGDTFDATVDIGFRLTSNMRLRLARVNAPELHSQDPVVRAAALKTKEYLDDIMKTNPDVVIETTKADAFGRYLAEVWFMTSTGKQLNVSSELLLCGLAVPYVKK